MTTENRRSSPSLLVGIPAYNEEATIGDVVARAGVHAEEVLVVDDGSDDRTGERARDAGAVLIEHEQNQGYGAALGRIFDHAHREGVNHLVILDADGQHDADDIPDLVRTQRETGAEVVTGSRFGGQGTTGIPMYRRFGLAVIDLLTNLGLRVGYSYPWISDTQCGFRAYDAAAIAAMANASEIGSGMGASLDILFQAAREGFEIVEVPTEIDYDVENSSTLNPVIHGLDLLAALFLVVARDRPVRTTLAVSTVLVLGGASVLSLGELGTRPIYALVPVFSLVVIGLSLALSGGSLKRSEGTDR